MSADRVDKVKSDSAVFLEGPEMRSDYN